MYVGVLCAFVRRRLLRLLIYAAQERDQVGLPVSDRCARRNVPLAVYFGLRHACRALRYTGSDQVRFERLERTAIPLR